MSRLTAESTNLQVLASALATIPGSSAIRVRPGQTPTRADAVQSLLYTLSLMTAAMHESRHAGSPRNTVSRRAAKAGRTANPRSSAA